MPSQPLSPRAGPGPPKLPTRASTSRLDHGQVTPLFAAVLVLGLLVAFLVVRAGVAADDRARAQAAADASALAGVGAGESAARELARRNGAVLVSYLEAGAAVEVVAVVGDARARARAVPGRPDRSTPGSSPTTPR